MTLSWVLRSIHILVGRGRRSVMVRYFLLMVSGSNDSSCYKNRRMKIHQSYIIVALLSLVAAPQLVEAQTITSATASPGAIPANVTTDIKFAATVTGRPLHVELTYLNGPAGHPIVVGQLRKRECGDHDDDGGDGDKDRDCRKGAANDVYTLSKQFNLPVGQAQFQISAPGPQGQVVSPVLFVLSLTTPVGFTIDVLTIKHGSPLSFNNFDSRYVAEGDFRQRTELVINVATVPLPPPPLANLIDIELQGTTIAARSALTVSGVSCTQVFYADDLYSPVGKVEAIYCPSGKSLYKFFLTYYTGDPNENQYLSSFQQLVSSAKFTP